MTTDEYIKAFTQTRINAYIEATASYKVGQTVYAEMDGMPVKAKVTGIKAPMLYEDYCICYGDEVPFGLESSIYDSFERLRTIVATGLKRRAEDWRKMEQSEFEWLFEEGSGPLSSYTFDDIRVSIIADLEARVLFWQMATEDDVIDLDKQ